MRIAEKKKKSSVSSKGAKTNNRKQASKQASDMGTITLPEQPLATYILL